MRNIKYLTIFTGKDAFPCDLTPYDAVVDNTIEFEDSVDFLIDFHKDGKLVRRLVNASCDIRYE
jgi:hypothetical protein